ncbi:class I SAM-dependent methyltransferase [Beggiatoa leptomitoformis]|uniref:Methyltransferase domain-containing protein n=1 Tax=Beggiatoa leptomitoformis TaxID=288004 RepID=A0A2N9YAT1_9GAMM|nr:class I SAM-dependent methyltransferase [Beggiatoa leptomitoformis]AUI67552.1 methyltransferase domain-containing protein [Beggiatoa leptomitoformis]QGX03537.1 methyltransferase domain-containing protein [Beggiatoa leptomitoformis]
MLKYFPPRYLFRRYEILRHLRPAKRFLEVGAGGLALSQELLAYFQAGKAVDFSPNIESYYMALPLPIRQRLTFEQGDVAQLPVADTYDCIVACEVMEHIEDDKQFLTTLYERLVPQGQLLISVPAHMKFWTIHDDITGHFRRYEKQAIIELFQQVGFENITVIAYGYPFINILRWLRALYAKKQAKVKASWDKNQQTQCSGINHVPTIFNWIGLFVNPYTVLPLNWIARLFNQLDLAEGYIIVADKPHHQLYN